MVTAVDVCNMAIGRLGTDQFISALTDAGKIAGTMRAYFDTTRRAALADYDWQFATLLEPLALTTNVPAPPWGFEYARPPCVRVQSVAVMQGSIALPAGFIPSGSASSLDFGGSSGTSIGGPSFAGQAQPSATNMSATTIPFATGVARAAGTAVYTAPGATIPVIWTNIANAGAWITVDVTDPNAWEPGFVTYLSWMLAADTAINITGSASIQQAMMQGAQRAMQAAMQAENSEETQTLSWGADWMDARDGGGYGGPGGYAAPAAVGYAGSSSPVLTAGGAPDQTASLALTIAQANAVALAALSAQFSSLTMLGGQLIVGFGSSLTVDGDGLLEVLAPFPGIDGITIYQNSSGVLAQKGTQIVSLPDNGPLTPTTNLVVFDALGNAKRMTQAEFFAGIFGITIDALGAVSSTVSFVVTGELTYPFAPVLTYSVNGGSYTAFNSGNGDFVTVNAGTGTFQVTVAALNSIGTNTLSIRDANGVTATASFVTSGTVAATVTLSGVPSAGTHGVALTGISATLTPSGATGWAVLFGPNGFEGSRQACTNGSFPTLTPLVAGNYKVNVFDQPTGGQKKATSSTIVVG